MPGSLAGSAFRTATRVGKQGRPLPRVRRDIINALSHSALPQVGLDVLLIEKQLPATEDGKVPPGHCPWLTCEAVTSPVVSSLSHLAYAREVSIREHADW